MSGSTFASLRRDVRCADTHEPLRGPPVVSQLLHQLLPVAAGAQVYLVEASDVLDDFLPLQALLQGHALSYVGCYLGYVFGFSIQPRN